jgi:hypothetical protein
MADMYTMGMWSVIMRLLRGISVNPVACRTSAAGQGRAGRRHV